MLSNFFYSKPRPPLFWGIWVLVGIKLFIHLWANQNYGFHRDELLHIACTRHLAWGYMEFPPLIAWLGSLSSFLWGDSLLSFRAFPAIVGSILVFLSAEITRSLGGTSRAQFLAASIVLWSPAYFRAHTLFQPVFLDIFFWTLSLYIFLKYLSTQNPYLLISLGLAIGIGILNKYLMLVWALVFFIALLLGSERKILKEKWIWLGALLSLGVVIPNVLWQYQQDFPIFDHLRGLYEKQLGGIYYQDFIIGQLGAMQWIAAPLWLIGLGFLLFSKKATGLRFFGRFILTVFFLLLFLKAKPYYLFGVYPFLVATGAYAFQELFPKQYQRLIFLYLPMIWMLGLYKMPDGTPFLPIEMYIEYAGLSSPQREDGRLTGLSTDYADMFGWEKQVRQVVDIYRTLSQKEQEQCIIWTDNYGEAGAVSYFGRKEGLPDPVCKHGSFYLWGPGKTRGEIAITLGIENKDWIASYYEEVIEVDRIFHPYAVHEEVDVAIYLCRKPKRYLRDHWAALRPYVFD